jgi:hypothetical protein
VRKFKIPSMGALLAFEAAARHESFTHAARELFLTESAVSRQIATLEGNLGVRLFVRVKQRVVLTKAGKVYSAQVARALEGLDRDTLSIIAHGSGGGYLELAALPTFASHWLIPRLADFNASYPDVRVNLGVRTGTFPFADGCHSGLRGKFAEAAGVHTGGSARLPAAALDDASGRLGQLVRQTRRGGQPCDAGRALRTAHDAD